MGVLPSSKPPAWRLLLIQLGLLVRFHYRPMQSSQYRLYGPGVCPNVAEPFWLRLPVFPSSHVWRKGVVGFVFDLATLGLFRSAANVRLAGRRVA
jgi:hypothetical protein